jgi:hypothetical protein
VPVRIRDGTAVASFAEQRQWWGMGVGPLRFRPNRPIARFGGLNRPSRGIESLLEGLHREVVWAVRHVVPEGGWGIKPAAAADLEN